MRQTYRISKHFPGFTLPAPKTLVIALVSRVGAKMDYGGGILGGKNMVGNNGMVRYDM